MPCGAFAAIRCTRAWRKVAWTARDAAHHPPRRRAGAGCTLLHRLVEAKVAEQAGITRRRASVGERSHGARIARGLKHARLEEAGAAQRTGTTLHSRTHKRSRAARHSRLVHEIVTDADKAADAVHRACVVANNATGVHDRRGDGGRAQHGARRGPPLVVVPPALRSSPLAWEPHTACVLASAAQRLESMLLAYVVDELSKRVVAPALDEAV